MYLVLGLCGRQSYILKIKFYNYGKQKRFKKGYCLYLR